MYIPSKTVKYFIFKKNAILLTIFEETYLLDFSPIWEPVCSSSSEYAMRLRVPGSNSDRDKRVFFFYKTSRLALGPAQPPIQCVPGFSIRKKSSRGVKLSTHLHLVPRLRMSGITFVLLLCAFKAWRRKTLFHLQRYYL